MKGFQSKRNHRQTCLCFKWDYSGLFVGIPEMCNSGPIIQIACYLDIVLVDPFVTAAAQQRCSVIKLKAIIFFIPLSSAQYTVRSEYNAARLINQS